MESSFKFIKDSSVSSKFSNEILTTLHRANKKQIMCLSRRRRISTLNNATWQLSINPIEHYVDNDLFLVTFETFAKQSKSENKDINDDLQIGQDVEIVA